MKVKIIELENKIRQYENNHYGLVNDDMFEFLVIARSNAMQGKIKEAIECSADFYRKVSTRDEIMTQVMTFFEGKTIKEKKDALRKFLTENPHYRTMDPKLLLQRLRLGKKYGEKFADLDVVPQNPIKDAIEQIKAEETKEEEDKAESAE